MQTQAYEGYFENGSFFASGRAVRLPEKKRVVITVLDEPIKIVTAGKEQRIKWLERLNAAIDLSADEELPFIHRPAVMREPIDISDEE